jgi:hypothetical protein
MGLDYVALIRRSAETRNPGYVGNLPRVFPYFVRRSAEEVSHLSYYLSLRLSEGDVHLCWAVTGHTSQTDGSRHLWLNRDAAEYLLLDGKIGSVEEAHIRI